MHNLENNEQLWLKVFTLKKVVQHYNDKIQSYIFNKKRYLIINKHSNVSKNLYHYVSFLGASVCSFNIKANDKLVRRKSSSQVVPEETVSKLCVAK